MGTTGARRARPLAVTLLLLLVLVLRSDAAPTARRKPHDDVDLLPWRGSDAFWGNETFADPVFAAITLRAADGGYSYGQVRWMIWRRCPRRASNEAEDEVTRRCYAKQVRHAEERVKAKPPPPPPQPEDEEAGPKAPWMLSLATIPVDRWPKQVVNPVIRSRPRWGHQWFDDVDFP